MKKKLGILSIILGVILIGGFTYQYFIEKVLGSTVDGRYFIGSGVATTSGVYLTGTASSTSQIIPLGDTIDEVAIKLLFNASSSLTRFDWKYEFSDNQIDWYSPLIATTTDTYPEYLSVASSTPTFYRYLTGSTATIKLFDQQSSIAADYMKITVQLGAAGYHGYVWGEVKPIRHQ